MKLLTVEECAKETAEIRTGAVAMQRRIHVVAVSTLVHIRDTGDTRGALALVTALPNGTRVEGLKAWYAGMSSGLLGFGKNADTGATTIKLAKDRVPAQFLIERAEETDFGSYTKEAKPRTLTVEQLLKQLSSKATDSAQNADGTPKVSPEARAVASAMLKSYHTAVAAAIH